MSTYDQQDIKAILNRAVALQQRSGNSESIPESSEKLSLEEIEEIARDAGVSPDYVREAALEFEGIPVEKPFFIDTGDYNRVELIGFAKGKLDKRTWAELRSIIEYHFDSPGKVTRRPDGIRWKAVPKGILNFLESRKSSEVELETENYRTSIRIRKSFKTVNKFYLPAIFAFMLSTIFFAFTVAGEFGNDFGAGLILTVMSLGAAELIRRWVNRKKKKRRNQLLDLMKELQTIVTRRFQAARKSESVEDPKLRMELRDLNSANIEQEKTAGPRKTKNR